MYSFGIDWSAEHHNLCVMNDKQRPLSQVKFPHSLEGFQQVEALRQQLDVSATECWVAIETAHNLLVEFLVEQGYVVYVIPPHVTHAQRQRYHASQAHTDDSDAALLARLLWTDREHYQPLRSDTQLTQHLRAQMRLVEQLRRAIHRQHNQLRAILLRTYPQAVELFSALTAQISLQFLLAYPTAQAATALSLDEFRAFCQRHQYTHPQRIAQRYAHLIAPAPTAHPATVSAYQEQVPIWAELLLLQVQKHKAAQRCLSELFAQHPDADIFASLPGAGALLAPALLAKFGDRRERFPTAAVVQALAGTCPITEQSGKKTYIHFRHSCDKEFRRIAQHFAKASLYQSGWAMAYFQESLSRGHSTSHAYRCLANRWLAVIWKMWQTRQPYDEGYHLRQRATRQRSRA
jgi:transposase